MIIRSDLSHMSFRKQIRNPTQYNKLVKIIIHIQFDNFLTR
jgi:hypothetical protein